MKRVVTLRRTQEDIERGRDFYNRREPGVGDYFVSSIYADIESLGSLNEFHPRRHGFHRVLASRFPFGIYYAVEANVVYVVAVVDLRRNPIRIVRQMKGRRME